MSSAPFVRPAEIVYGRDTYIPEWAPRVERSDLTIAVKQGGVPLGFTIGDMLPERTWAVDLQTGEVMEQREFTELYKQWIMRAVKTNTDGAAQIVQVAKWDKYHDFSLDPVPSVRNWVSRTLDYQGKEIAIGFDPDATVDVPEHEVKIYTAQGEEWTPRQRENESIRTSLSLLMKLRADGVLTDEQFTAQALELGATGDAELVASTAPEGFDAVAGPVDVKDLTAPCGKICGSPAGRAAHMRKCETCSPKET